MLCAAFCVLATSASAQDAAPQNPQSPLPFDAATECAVHMAEITDLREPRFGAASVWDLLYAEDGMDSFSDLVMIDDSHFVAAGSYTKDKDDKIYHPLLVKYDERLKPVWATREETKEQRTIHRIVKSKDGFMVMGDLSDPAQGNGLYIMAYGEDGKALGKPMPVFEPGGDLDGKAMIPAQDGGGYIVAAQFTNARNAEDQHGILYKLSPGGKTLWKRAFHTGGSTVFNTVQATLDGNYILGGQVVTDNNRSAGWLVRVDDKGAIQWQRTYPRGLAATLQSVQQGADGSYTMAGKIRPFAANGKGLSAWIMKTDSAGAPLWQRYMRGPYDYQATDLIVYQDGRASVLINAGAMESQRRSHVRLVTLSPQGGVHHLEDFTEGQNATASRLVSGMGAERILIGHAQTSFGEKQEGNEAAAAPSYTFDAWLMAAEPLNLFDDPCAGRQKMSPILP